MEQPTHKYVNGVLVELTQEEQAAILAEWEANAPEPEPAPE